MTSLYYKTIYEKAVFLDTSGIIALSDPDDLEHQNAQTCIQSVIKQKYPIFISNVTIIESQKRLLFDIGYSKALHFLNCIYSNKVNIVRLVEDDEIEAKRIINKFSDQKFTFADAINFSIMKRYSIFKVFSFDHHFSVFGFEKIPPFFP